MARKRVSAFIDGFNLYHSIDHLRQDHLKWLNLFRLCQHFAPAPAFELRRVYYFSAFATWRPGPYKRHRQFVRALEAVGVTPILGNFKEKDRKCFRCHRSWKAREEKETDVNIALHLIMSAVKDEFDRALLVTRDSDLVPAVSMLRKEFPEREIRIITPVHQRHSLDLRNAAGKANCRKMKLYHLERSLLPKEVRDNRGKVVAVRPTKYDPPNHP